MTKDEMKDFASILAAALTASAETSAAKTGEVVAGVLRKLQEPQPIEEVAAYAERIRAPAREKAKRTRSWTRRARVPVSTKQGVYDVECTLGFQSKEAFEDRPAANLFIELPAANFDAWVRDRGTEFDKRHASEASIRENDPAFDQEFQRQRQRYIAYGERENPGFALGIRAPLINMLAGKTEEYMTSRGWLLPETDAHVVEASEARSATTDLAAVPHPPPILDASERARGASSDAKPGQKTYPGMV